MRHFPVFMDLHGRHALVLGAGEVADRKAAELQAAGAQLRRATRFDPSLLDGCAIAIAAGAQDLDLQALAEAAKSAGIPVNVVDRPDLSSFITPATIDRAPIT